MVTICRRQVQPWLIAMTQTGASLWGATWVYRTYVYAMSRRNRIGSQSSGKMSASSAGCLCCQRPPSAQRPAVQCEHCSDAFYCSNDCREAHASEHAKACPGQQAKASKGKKAQLPKEELLKPIEKKDGVPEVTLQELADCQSSGKLWIGCMGRVFDVTGSEFYGAAGNYSSFVGKDTSVALGKMKFNKEYFDPAAMHWRRDLDEKELNILNDWMVKFADKYPLVGYIKG